MKHYIPLIPIANILGLHSYHHADQQHLQPMPQPPHSPSWNTLLQEQVHLPDVLV